MATTEEQIAQLRAILAAGANSGSIDGRTVQFDLAEVRKQLRVLTAELAEADETTNPRPVASRILTSQ
jgi:hypothetical protein